MGMLKSHMDAVEEHLLAISRIPANSGHSLHKGTPREAFIRAFLEDHLNQDLALGTGEIIDAESQPNVSRNQPDIVIYKKSYPRLSLGGGIHAFLAESVVATIEVKSTLTEVELRNSIRSATNVKALKRSVHTTFSAGYQPPSIFSYVLAYNGPAKLATVHEWIGRQHIESGIPEPDLPQSIQGRTLVPAPSIDGVFHLGKGFLHLGVSRV